MGVTPGLRGIAGDLEVLGHQVEVVDLYDGASFTSLDEGIAHAESVGFDQLIERGLSAVDPSATGIVVVGFSLGVLPAQKLAQTHAGVSGAFLCDAVVDPVHFGSWPEGIRAEVHLVADDEFVAEDLEAGRTLATHDGVDLTVHPGSGHLMVDPSSPDFDQATSQRIIDRLQAFAGDAAQF